MEEHIQVFVSVPDKKQGRHLAQVLAEEHLAACVQVLGPMTSVYRWQGEVETAEEYLCLIKTTAVAFERLRARILTLHPYDVPEIIAVPITGGSEEYLDWLDSSVAGDGKP